MNKAKWKILARHKWSDGILITESVAEHVKTIPSTHRFTATIRGWRNWKLFEGKLRQHMTRDVIALAEAIRDRIDKGDESVFEKGTIQCLK